MTKSRWIEMSVARGATAARGTWSFARLVYRWEGVEVHPKPGLMSVFFWNWVRTVGLLLILWLLDPLGVVSNSNRVSAELFYRVVSADYEPPTNLNNRGSKNPLHDNTEIAVIIINDETLQVRDQPWPPPFSVHAEIIEKVLIYNPKALLIDFGFFDEAGRGDIKPLTDVLENRYEQPPLETHKLCNPKILKFKECEGEARRVPVFLAGAPRALGPGKEKYWLKVVPALKDAVTGTVSTRYSTEHELPYNSYPLHDCFTREPSAALAMYAVGNDEWDAWGLNVTPCPNPAQREKRDWQGGPNKLSVYWASWGDVGSSRGSYQCKALPESVPERIVQVVWIWLTDLFGSGKKWRDQFQACPPHRSYAAHDFLADESPGLAEFLDGRYVFYGGNFAMADDLITPPTHEPVPGVFLHAMALDNLLRRGKRYIRVEGESGLIAATTWLTLAAIAFAGICTVMAWNGYEALTERPARPVTDAAPYRPEPYRSKLEIIWDWMRPIGSQLLGAGWVLMFISLSVVGTFLALWIGFSVLMLAPINYIGILSFVGVHTIVRGGREFLDGILSL